MLVHNRLRDSDGRKARHSERVDVLVTLMGVYEKKRLPLADGRSGPSYRNPVPNGTAGLTCNDLEEMIGSPRTSLI